MLAKLLLLPLLLAGDDAKKPDLTATWKAVSIEVDGKNALNDLPQEFRLIITDKTIKVEVGEPNKQDPQFTYKIDNSTTPKILDLKGTGDQKDMLFEAIYELSGDDLKICVRGPSGVKERPTEFTSKGGMIVLTLKRVK